MKLCSSDNYYTKEPQLTLSLTFRLKHFEDLKFENNDLKTLVVAKD